MNTSTAEAGIALFISIAVANLSLFTFLAVVVWVGGKRREREAFYRAETMKRIVEAGGERSPALDFMREQEKLGTAKRLAGFRLGGLVNLAIGLALMILLRTLVHGSGVFLAGLFPLLIGLALLAYAFWHEPRAN